MKRIHGLSVVLGLTLAVSACGSAAPSPAKESPSASATTATTAPAPSPKPSKAAGTTPQPWAGAPTDGTWDRAGYSDAVGFGQWSKAGGVRTHVYMVSDVPTMTTTDGKKINVTLKVHVKRANDREPGDTWLTAYFTPGNLDAARHNEAYGRTTLKCAESDLQPDGETTCEATFKAPADEVPNHYWVIWGNDLGTWPSQTT